MFLCGLSFLEEYLIETNENVLVKTLAQRGKNAMLERAFRLESFKSDEILEGNVAGDFFDKFSVAQPRPLLNNQGSKSPVCRDQT